LFNIEAWNEWIDKLLSFHGNRNFTKRELKLNRLVNSVLLLMFIWGWFLSIVLIVLYIFLLEVDTALYAPYAWYYTPIMVLFVGTSILTYYFRFRFHNPVYPVVVMNILACICLGIIGILVGREGNTYMIMAVVLPLPFYYLKDESRKLLWITTSIMIVCMIGFSSWVYTHPAILPTPEFNTDASQVLVFVGIASVFLQFSIQMRLATIRFENTIEGFNQELLDRDEEVRMELKLAADIQQNLFPVEISSPLVTIEQYSQAYNEVTGDYFDLYVQGDDTWLLLADISGHGIPAALISILVKQTFRKSMKIGGTPGEVLDRVNRELVDQIVTSDYLTAFLVKLSAGKMQYTCASHTKSFLVRDGLVLPELDSEGYILGALTVLPGPYEVRTQEIQPGDQIILYTDGITEQLNHSREQYGADRLRKSLEEGMTKQSQRSVVDVVMESWNRHRNGKSIGDDVTLVVATIK
jgi:serine phosphatase RsbU (regulator of sigma subunit)